jgi:O-acetyl-ADP-ribose deacetylase (regulator of RNase III)
MARKKIKGVNIECVQGDIASQDDMQAVVNAANAQLMPGGGVAGAIHRKAGRGLAEECKPLAPIKPGEAVITGAHELPNEYVIHCLGPVYGVDKPEDKLLASCYEQALDIAEEKKITSVAFPALSTGAFGYPMKEAAEIAFETVKKKADSLQSVTTIRFVLFSKSDLQKHEEVFNRVFG